MPKPTTPVVLRWYQRTAVAVGDFEPSKTQQHFKAECDINYIVDRGRVRPGDHFNQVPPMFGDFTNLPAYQDMANMLRQADDAFMSLPASTRAYFDNDPGRFIAAAQDPAMLPELCRLGLAVSTPAPASPEPVRPSSPPPEAGTA